MAWIIDGTAWPRNANLQLVIKETLRLVHPDQHNTMGPRVHYAASACTAFLNRCTEALTQTSSRLTELLPMPNILITPFTASQALVYPPSAFEYEAAKRCKNRPSSIEGVDLYNQRWADIESSRADIKVVEAESRFWLVNWYSRRPQERDNCQIYFAEYEYNVDRKEGTFNLKGMTQFMTQTYIDSDGDEIEVEGHWSEPSETFRTNPPLWWQHIRSEEEGDSLHARPLYAYAGFLSWFHNNATLDSRYEWTEQAYALEMGELTWPSVEYETGETPLDHISGAALAMLRNAGRVITDGRLTRNRAKKLVRMAKRMLSDEAYLDAGPRVRYAIEACTAVLNRCRAALTATTTTKDSQLPELLPMPRPLITPFNIERWWDHPPSMFEFVAYGHRFDNHQFHNEGSYHLWDKVCEEIAERDHEVISEIRQESAPYTTPMSKFIGRCIDETFWEEHAFWTGNKEVRHRGWHRGWGSNDVHFAILTNWRPQDRMPFEGFPEPEVIDLVSDSEPEDLEHEKPFEISEEAAEECVEKEEEPNPTNDEEQTIDPQEDRETAGADVTRP